MKSEEAIKEIKNHCYFSSLVPDAKSALDTAINALEENKALRKLLDWATECDFDVESIDPDGEYIEQLNKFWEENDKATYTDGLIYLARLIIEDEENGELQ